MNKHLQKIITLLKAIYGQCVLWYREQPKKIKAIVWVVGLLLAIFLFKIIFLSGKADVIEVVPNRKVTISSISSLGDGDQDFPLVGTVTSVNEATIRSEAGGKLTIVYKKLGDTVYAGGIIAQFENSAERASVLQAEGAYEQAKAARSIASLNNNQAGTSLLDSRTAALNAISSAYTNMDDALRGKTDGAYSDPKFEQVQLLLSLPDANLSLSLETKRKAIEKMITRREERNRSLSETSDLVGELTSIQNEARTIKSYLDDLFTAYSKAIPDAKFNQALLDGGKASVSGARVSISGTISSLWATRSALTGSMTANQIAGGQGGEISGTLATSDAQVKQALGAYNATLSRLEKTIIRSPITGTINSLSIDTGDYIPSFSQVAVVSNNGALEVFSFVTEDDAKRITVGSSAKINNTVDAVVTRIASAIDPVTKKIELRLGIKDPKATLINGQSVRIIIRKNKKEITRDPTSPIIIPISALKLTPRGANVFTVSASSTLISIPVKEGAILGEKIQILEGLTGNEKIVTDARGLKDGATVEVAQ